ncbi:hypothetical protein ACH4UY_35095 [Streptomyces longwoodensis]|uniref:hypothetical protein n=1 Tax=Streptomyces longwoodensis TaxID=68231 RepID=UPI0037A0CA17
MLAAVEYSSATMSQPANTVRTAGEFGHRDGVLAGNGLLYRQAVFVRGRLQQSPRLWQLHFGNARR